MSSQLDHPPRDAGPRPGMRLLTPAQFVAEKPERAAVWVEGRPHEQRLAGADFGYRWRRDGDDDHTHLQARGLWRLSWIPETNELYAELKQSGPRNLVMLIGTFREPPPAGWKFLPIEKWGPVAKVLTIESRQDEPNSLGLVLDLLAADLEHAT